MFPTVEYAPVDVFGKMSAWVDAREMLTFGRAFPGSATIGRYIYVFGGTDGASPLISSERALVLSQLRAPLRQPVEHTRYLSAETLPFEQRPFLKGRAVADG